MKVPFAAGIAAFAVVFAGQVALGQATAGNGKVKARLLADVASVKPGESFNLAVELKIEPEWHVYWKHPGEAGLPTTVNLKLPEGVKAGAWRYPTPKAFDQAGILSFGYGDEVVLMTTVRVPASWQGGSVAIEGTVRFLVCHDVCLPGSAKVSATVPVGEGGGKANTEVFQKWGASVPVERKLVEGGIPAGEELQEGKVRVELPEAVGAAEFFPAAPAALVMEDVAVAVEGNMATVTFKSKRLKGQAMDDKGVEAVLGYTDKERRRRGVRVDVPLVGK